MRGPAVRPSGTALVLGVLVGAAITMGRAYADEAAAPPSPDLVKQASAPISSIFQLRVQDSYAPEFVGADGAGNTLTLSMTMPLPRYRLLPLPQLSLLTMPTAVTLPSGDTGFGDMRFLDIAVLDAGHDVLFGIGPAFVFPTASDRTTGQGKWQAGPAAAVAIAPRRWLAGILAYNPVSFGGDPMRSRANALFLQPFVTLQLGGGWFVRSQPQIVFDWTSRKQLVPIDLGVGRVFRIGRRQVSCFVEPFWNASTAGPAPRYGITFGMSFLYPNFWRRMLGGAGDED